MPLPRGILHQKVVPVELLVLDVSLLILVSDGTRLVCIGQLEFEHQLKQLGVGGIFHNPLAFQPSCAHGSSVFLCLSGGCRGISAPLKAVGDAQHLPRLLVHLAQICHLVLQIPGEVVHADHVPVCRVA